MKKLIAALFVLSVPAGAAVIGKLDIMNPEVDVIVLRELNDGLWMGGAQKQIGHIERSDGTELAHLSAFYATRPEVGSTMAYGPSIGVNIGGLAHEIVLKIAALAELAYACPPFVGKIGSWTSLDFYGGYRPVAQYDEHHIIYGVGGKITIPLSGWTGFVSKEQGGGL